MKIEWILVVLLALLGLYFLPGCDLWEQAQANWCPTCEVCDECVTDSALFWVDEHGATHGDVSQIIDLIFDGE